MQLNAASACFVGTVNTLLSHDMRAKECKYSKTYTKKTVLGLLPCGDFQRYSAIVNFTSSVFFFFVRTIKSSAASKSVWRGDVINGLLQLIPMEMKVGIDSLKILPELECSSSPSFQDFFVDLAGLLGFQSESSAGNSKTEFDDRDEFVPLSSVFLLCMMSVFF